MSIDARSESYKANGDERPTIVMLPKKYGNLLRNKSNGGGILSITMYIDDKEFSNITFIQLKLYNSCY